VDNDNVPVYYERIAAVDPKTLLKAVSQEDLLHYHVYCQEKAAIQLNELGKKLNKPIFGNTVVEDLNGLGWKHYNNQALAILKQIIAIDEANYPEILKRYYLINAPRFFQVLWAVGGFA
jgi:phosphatidylinositol/phosphatidylcholine transfer protein